MWSILGAREGCYMTNCTNWDYANVRDFDYLTDLWKENHEGQELSLAKAQSQFYGSEIRNRLGLEIADLNEDGSKFFKSVYLNSKRGLRKY
jgi:hypothetical protein